MSLKPKTGSGGLVVKASASQPREKNDSDIKKAA
jgi:hypothetical protein